MSRNVAGNDLVTDPRPRAARWGHLARASLVATALGIGGLVGGCGKSQSDLAEATSAAQAHAAPPGPTVTEVRPPAPVPIAVSPPRPPSDPQTTRPPLDNPGGINGDRPPRAPR